MKPTIHEKIKDKIESKEIPPPIEEFLRKVLAEELRHLEEKRWRYGKKYDRYIKKYADKLEEKEGLNEV